MGQRGGGDADGPGVGDGFGAEVAGPVLAWTLKESNGAGGRPSSTREVSAVSKLASRSSPSVGGGGRHTSV
jgi:hypothetical protein